MRRRNFLKTVGASTAGLAAFSCADRDAASRLAASGDGFDENELTWSKAPCRYCGTGCGVEVGVREGKVVTVRGDEKSPVNRGLMCVKGYHLPGMLYGEDRLKYPMLRDGDGWKRISWDEALDLVARKYQEALDESGPESVAIYGSGQWTVFDGYAASKWFRAGLKSNNVEPNARLCMASAVTGFMTQFQSDEPMGCYEDFEVGDDFILWGNNMAEMHPVLFSRILANKRENPGVRIVDIGTRRTPTTDYADMYVEFIPGSDLALANGILHLLVRNGKISQAFLRENVVFKRGIEDISQIGFGSWGPDGLGLDPSDGPAEHYRFSDQGRDASLAELETFLADYTPERVSEISGVPVGQIHALADMYGDPGRGTVSTWCMGVNQHTRGTWMNNLITDLHLITGKISRPGSNPFSLTGQPSACGTVREVGTLAHRLPADMVVMNPEHRAKAEEIWGVPSGTINPKPGLHTMDMFRAFMRGEVKVMWTQTTNPWVSIPNLNRIQREPGDGRFLIVSDIYPTPTTEVADLVLPAAAWVEREGVFGNTERRTQHWHKAVDPPGEATRRRVADHRSREADGHGTPVPVARGRLAQAHVRGVPQLHARTREGRGFVRAARADARHAVAGGGRRGDAVSVRRRARPVREEGARRALLQGQGIRREGRVLDPPLAPAGGGTGRGVPVLAVHGPRARALAHRVHDAPGEAAAPGGEGRLRRDEPGGRPAARSGQRTDGSRREPSRRARVARAGGRARQAAAGLGVHSVLRRSAASEHPHPRRDGQHLQGTGLQEVRGPGREGLRGGGMRASIVTVRAAAGLTALVALVAAGCSDPGKVPVPDREGAVKSTASVRAERRAYDGAPPIVPHQDFGAACGACHDSARSVGAWRGLRARVAARRHVEGRCDHAVPPVPRVPDHRRPVRGFGVRGHSRRTWWPVTGPLQALLPGSRTGS